MAAYAPAAPANHAFTGRDCDLSATLPELRQGSVAIGAPARTAPGYSPVRQEAGPIEGVYLPLRSCEQQTSSFLAAA
jgi:hypothetical protein